jgi:hypothetical protein
MRPVMARRGGSGGEGSGRRGRENTGNCTKGRRINSCDAAILARRRVSRLPLRPPRRKWEFPFNLRNLPAGRARALLSFHTARAAGWMILFEPRGCDK